MAHGSHHIIPLRTLLYTFGGLVFLTFLTLWTGTAAWIPPALHIPVAILIAGAKTALVVMYFMGLKYDNAVNSLAFLLSIVFVVIFLTFTMIDALSRGDLADVDTLTIADRELLLDRMRTGEISQEERTMMLNSRFARVPGVDYSLGEAAAAADSLAAAPADSASVTP